MTMSSGRTRLRVATTWVVSDDVPNINAQADNFRVARQDGFDDIGGPLLNVKFQQAGLGAQRSEIGQQVTQPEGGVDIPGVQSGEDNRSHRFRMRQIAF
jgi:hypothetical protein